MKKCISKSASLILILCMIVLVLPSCNSMRSTPVTRSNDSVNVVHKNASRDTNLLWDSIYRHDSIIYRERTIHDTVYITKEIYRDTHNSSLIARNSAQADTIHIVEYRDRVIEQPPKRYVPKFYKHCTTYFWGIVVLFLLYIVFRLTKSKLLQF